MSSTGSFLSGKFPSQACPNDGRGSRLTQFQVGKCSIDIELLLEPRPQLFFLSRIFWLVPLILNRTAENGNAFGIELFCIPPFLLCHHLVATLFEVLRNLRLGPLVL